MIVYFVDGSSIGVRIDPERLYDIWQEAKRKLITCFIGFPRQPAGQKRNVLDIDPRTFEKAIISNFPSLPPDVPPDTDRGYMLDADEAGDPGDCHKSTPPAGGPASSTLPCREK